MLNRDDFFREATVRLCSSPQVEKSLQACLLYLREAMPGDHLLLHVFEHGLGALRTIAIADVGGGGRVDHVTSVPPEATRKSFHQALAPVRLANDSDDDPINRAVCDSFAFGPSSLLLVFLGADGGAPIGHLTLQAAGRGRYTDAHLELLASLRGPFTLLLTTILALEEAARLRDLLQEERREQARTLRDSYGAQVIGANGGLKEVMSKVRQVAGGQTPVLLLGETGVGKDVIANALHELSPRRDGPFIKVNCGAIPETLIDSELFGHERGAFSGAVAQARGRFERAHGGTIFLDELGELPLSAQVRLLRVLQSKEIERVGGSKAIAVDIRILAATHRDLEDMVEQGTFRQDLWFRLNVFPICIPPLRARKADLPALVHHLLDKKARELRLPALSELPFNAIDPLLAYDWPGNVRELENVIERALILGGTGPLVLAPMVGAAHPVNPIARGESPNLDAVVRQHIEDVLAKTRGRIHGPDGAAELLGMNAGTLRHRMDKLGIAYGRRRMPR